MKTSREKSAALIAVAAVAIALACVLASRCRRASETAAIPVATVPAVSDSIATDTVRTVEPRKRKKSHKVKTRVSPAPRDYFLTPEKENE